LSHADGGRFAKYEDALAAELEERDYDIKKNVFWVKACGRASLDLAARASLET